MKLRTILLTTCLFAFTAYEASAKKGQGPIQEFECQQPDYSHMGIQRPHTAKDVLDGDRLETLKRATSGQGAVGAYLDVHFIDFLPRDLDNEKLRTFVPGLSHFGIDQLETIRRHIAPFWTQNVSVEDRLLIMREAIQLEDLEKRALNASHWMRRILMADNLHHNNYFWAEPLLRMLFMPRERYPMDLNKVRGYDYAHTLIALLQVDPQEFDKKMKAAEKSLKALIQRPAKESRYDVIARDLRAYIISALLQGTTKQIEVIGRYGSQFFTSQMNGEARGKVIQNLMKGTPDQIRAILENPSIRFMRLSSDHARNQVFEALLKLDPSQIRKAGAAFKKGEVDIPSYANPGVPTQATIDAVVEYLNGLQTSQD